MKLDFSVPSTFLSSLQPDLPIEARTPAYPDTVFSGKVVSIASQIDPASRSVTIRAIIPNESRLLRPGLLMTVHLKKNERTAIMVPELAVIVEGANKYVYTVEDARAIKKQVAIGLREPGYVEITDGLSPGETIVTDGILKLSDQSPVRVSAKRTAGDTLTDLLQQSETATVQE
jgi:membrane fusion protein (multidrug efflux system)